MENKLRRKVVILILVVNLLLLNSNFMVVFSQGLDSSEMTLENDLKANQPPNEPTDPSPKNNSYGLGTSVELSVYVSDPDGDVMDVTFINATDDTQIGSPPKDYNGTYFINWENLSHNYRYYWYVVVSDGSNTVTSQTWTFSTSTIDSIDITDTPDGSSVSSKKVSAGFEESVNCSTYNQTEGYIGTVFANWTAEGGDSYLLQGNGTDENTINVGSIGGDVWLNASYDNNNFTDSVQYTVKSPTIDYIEIVDTANNGSETIQNISIPIFSSLTGYTAAFNNSIGYMEDVDVNWTVMNESTNAATSPNIQSNTSTLDSGDLPGQAVWTAEYNETINETVNITIYDDIPPELSDKTTDEPSTGDIFQFKVNVTDEVDVDDVFVEYSVDYGIYSNGSMVKDVDDWFYEFEVPSSADTLNYSFKANDTSNNWNSTIEKSLNVIDNDPPSINITTTETPSTNSTFNVTADVNDNKKVNAVYLNYSISTVEGYVKSENITMAEGYYKEIYVLENATDLNYNISAEDEEGNWNVSDTFYLRVNDSEEPSIKVTTTQTPSTGDKINITADVSDNIEIEGVYLNYSMVSTSGYIKNSSLLMETSYYKNVLIWSNATVFNYLISALDTSSNWNESPEYNMDVEDDDSPSLMDNSPTQGTAGEQFTFNASVEDNILVDNVYVYYWTDTSSPTNMTMFSSGANYYEESIQLPLDCSVLYYNISAVDSSSNWIETNELSTEVKDEDSPIIKITTNAEPSTGGYFNVTANITDNIGINKGWLQYIIEDKKGDMIIDNVTMKKDSSWYREIKMPMDSVNINYSISAEDISGNWNNSDNKSLEVLDDIPPTISLNMDFKPTSGQEYTFNITVEENIQVDTVTVEYWTDVTGFKQETMSVQNGKFYISTVQIPSKSHILHYNFTAVDISSNKNRTEDYQKNVLDKTSPEIISSNVSPDPTHVHLNTNFTCDVSDNINVSSVYINLFGPDSEKVGNFSMSSQECYYYTYSFQDAGKYSYHISAVDSSDNWVKSEIKDIKVRPPKIDYVQIRNESNNQGRALNNITLEIEDSVTLYAAGYNDTFGYQRDLTVSWASSNNDAMTVDTAYGTSTNCTPISYDTGKIYAFYEGIEVSIDFQVIEPQDPSITPEIPNIQLEEDFGTNRLNLSGYASDIQDSKGSLKWYIKGVNESIISVVGENLTGNHVLTLISQKDKYGDMKIEYILVDSDGNKDSQIAWINVTFVNDPPKFKDVPDLFVRYGKPYVFDYSPYISDPDTPKSEIELETDDPDHTEVDALKITYLYPEELVNDTIYLTLKATDGSSTTNRVVRITVTADHPPENVKRLPDIVLKENETRKNVFDLDDYIMDPDRDSLYMSYGYTNLDITIHDNHSVDIKAPEFWSGREKVTFRATDPIGAIVEQTINITVLPVNSPPEIRSLPNFVVHYDYPYNFDLRWYISDPDNSIDELEISTSDPNNVSVVGTTLKMEYQKEYGSLSYPYTVPLTIYLSDGINETSCVTNVSVTDNYPPDILVPLNDVIFNEDESIENAFDLDDHFLDRDSDTVYYTSGNENVIVDINDNNTVDFSAPPNWNGEELITIRATDDEDAFIEDTFKVYVLPVNDPPVIKEIPDQESEMGEDWVLDLGEYIYDVDNELEELTVSVNTSNIVVAGHKLIFTYPRRPMKENVQINVSDGSLENSTSMNVTILESKDEKSTSILDSPYIYTLVPLMMLLFALIFYIRKSEYTIDDIFLIHESGNLIKHTAREAKADRDEDILAGMFTAVQNFIKDAFADGEDETLKRMEYGDKKVLIHKGNHVTLAVFFTGDEPKWALESMGNLVRDVEERYKGDIEDWSGSTDDLPGITKMLNSVLKKGKYKKGDWKDLE
ncbi:MAG: hypothetical protein ACOC40_00570 [Thermoplasmatota archaeon]